MEEETIQPIEQGYYYIELLGELAVPEHSMQVPIKDLSSFYYYVEFLREAEGTNVMILFVSQDYVYFLGNGIVVYTKLPKDELESIRQHIDSNKKIFEESRKK